MCNNLKRLFFGTRSFSSSERLHPYVTAKIRRTTTEMKHVTWVLALFMNIPRWSVAELEKEVLVKNCKIVKGCE